jgi:hypothetical protein
VKIDEKDAMQHRTVRRLIVHGSGALALAALAFYLPTAQELQNLYGFGDYADGELCWALALLFGLIALLVDLFAALVFAVRLLLGRGISRCALVSVGYSTLFLISTVAGFALESELGRIKEARLVDRGRPLVTAIKLFVADNERPPADLEELTPSYLSEIPKTDLADYPAFKIATCDTDTNECFGDHWLLYADAIETKIMTRGFGGCDRYIFAPSGRYPPDDVDTICHYGEVDEGWNYEYGD